MSRLIVHLLIALSLITCVLSRSYFYGDRSKNRTKIHREKVVFYAIPWKKRIETYSFNDTLQRNIKGMDCHDYQRTEATVNITDGGIGFPYVTLRFKSQRSYGLEYAIEIFA